MCLCFLIRIPDPTQEHRQHARDAQPWNQRHETPPDPILKRIPHYVLHRGRKAVETRHRRKTAAVEQGCERVEVSRGERESEGRQPRRDVRVHSRIEDGEALRETDGASEGAELRRGKERVSACTRGEKWADTQSSSWRS